MIVRVSLVLKTICDDIDWRFDNLRKVIGSDDDFHSAQSENVSQCHHKRSFPGLPQVKILERYLKIFEDLHTDL